MKSYSQVIEFILITSGVLKHALDKLPKDLQWFNFQFFTERDSRWAN